MPATFSIDNKNNNNNNQNKASRKKRGKMEKRELGAENKKRRQAAKYGSSCPARGVGFGGWCSNGEGVCRHRGALVIASQMPADPSKVETENSWKN